MIDVSMPTKPAAPDQYTQKRWTHTALRRRMMSGLWIEDLEEELARHIATDRRASWGVADLSTNVMKSVYVALAALYNDPPAIGVVGASEGAADLLLERDGLIERAGLWPMMQRVQELTLALREMFVRVDTNSHKDGLLFRPVSPDMIWAESPAGDPMNPDHLWELRLRKHPDIGTLIWTWDIFDLRDKDNPIYAVREAQDDGSAGSDMTELYLGGDMSGSNYPYRQSDGIARLPYSIYHATISGSELFDPFYGAELVAGALTSAVLSTYLIHLARDCSHPQRYVMGAQLAGAGVYDADGSARRSAISSDPASILVFSPSEDMAGIGQPIIGQNSAGGNPGDLMEMITLYERKLAQSAGISAASVQKLSGDPRSGYAIAMSKSDQRDAQRRYAPAMKFGDIATIELAAIISNRFLGSAFPEEGYRVAYSSIPLSKQEAEAIRQDVIDKMSAGLITPVEAIKSFHPEFSTDEAIEYLREVRRQKIEFGQQ